ncbi:MAG: WD40 repeat protein, partial [Candidatus Marinamargulisbacteria bacterium]
RGMKMGFGVGGVGGAGINKVVSSSSRNVSFARVVDTMGKYKLFKSIDAPVSARAAVISGAKLWMAGLGGNQGGGTVTAYDFGAKAFEPTFSQGHSDVVEALVVTDNRVISADRSGGIQVRDKEGASLVAIAGHEESVTALVVAGDTLWSASRDKSIKSWDLNSGSCVGTIVGHSGGINAMTKVGQFLVTGSGDETVKVWDSGTGRQMLSFDAHKGGTKFTCFGIQGDRLFIGEASGRISEHNIMSGEFVREYNGHIGSVNAVAFGPTGNLISGSSDSDIRVWNTNTGKCTSRLKGDGKSASSVNALFSDSKGLIVCCTTDKRINLFKASSKPEQL